MERPRGLEPPPTAWQAVVLPLYYGRFVLSTSLFITRTAKFRQALPRWQRFARNGSLLQPARRIAPDRGGRCLSDFQYACRTDDRRLLLAFREVRGFFAVNVNAREFFAVLVVHRHLPVMVLPAFIFAQLAFFPTFDHLARPSINSFQTMAIPVRSGKCQFSRLLC